MGRNLRGRLAAVALAAVLLAAWLIPGAANENRAPEQLVPLTPGSLASANIFRSADRVLVQHLGLKQASVFIVANALRAVGASPSPDVVLAADGEPFLADEFRQPCLFDLEALQTGETLADVRDEFAADGTYFLYAVVPDKSSIQRAALGPNADALMVCVDRNREYLAELDDADSPLLTAWDEFSAAATSERLFLFGDSHWSTEGSALFSRLLIDRLERDGQAPDDLARLTTLVDGGQVEYPGNLYTLMGEPTLQPVTRLTTERVGVSTEYSAQTLDGGFVTERWVSTSSGASLISGRTLIIHDSAFGYNAAILAPYFADLTAVNLKTLSAPGYLVSGHYDRVIVQQVQRTIPAFLSEIVGAAELWEGLP
jgi:hypothetical protein